MGTDALAASLAIYSISQVLMILLAFVAVFVIIKMVLYGPKSQQHRKLLTNLYVAGKIRQLAKKDGVDLNDELKELLRTLKEQRKYNKPLDDTIELELQDKIMKEAEAGKK